jgi:hypothetical protein
MFFAAMIRYPICIQSVLRILSDGPSLELCNSSQGVGSLTPMRQCLLRRLSRHHEPKPAFVAGTRERKESECGQLHRVIPKHLVHAIDSTISSYTILAHVTP